ncbi:MAG: hypothetical protein KDI48_06480, partial [Xanthomonadales bacterium]|nr:hypothetical protein [Xanthomonadales bacterium]
QTGTVGSVTTGNSFVGRGNNERTGLSVTALSNGNYVVSSPGWMNGPTVNAGAVTLLAGNGPVSTFAGTAISLVGSSPDDQVGAGPGRIIALSNGNYVVASSSWDNGANADVGAVTWGSGTSGVTGVISAANSLVGTTPDDQIGESVTALTNGHYVAASPSWSNGAFTDAGAFTWGNGNSGTVGPVSGANSMVGSAMNDFVGSAGGAIPLSNGNYVVRSRQWDNGAVADAGAVTWRNGTVPTSGAISPANSIVGSSAGDNLGQSVLALPNGHFVLTAPSWDNGAISGAGAVSWVNGATGRTGPLSAANSLVGTTVSDALGQGLRAYSDANYVIRSPLWDNGNVVNAGAVTLALGTEPLSGNIMAANSVLGGISVGSSTFSIDYDPTRQRVAVGRPAENLLSLLTLGPVTDELFANGFEN